MDYYSILFDEDILKRYVKKCKKINKKKLKKKLKEIIKLEKMKSNEI